MPAAGCVSSQNPIFDRALVRTRPARNQLRARVSILQLRLQCRRNFYRERMIVKAEIEPPSPLRFGKDLPFLGKDLPFFGNDIPPSCPVRSGGYTIVRIFE